jgi:hypothetical protein
MPPFLPGQTEEQQAEQQHRPFAQGGDVRYTDPSQGYPDR